MALDLTIQALFGPIDASREDGYELFLEVLSALGQTRLADAGWTMALPREMGDRTSVDPFTGRDEALNWMRWRDAHIGAQDPPLMGYDLLASEPSEDFQTRRYDAALRWHSSLEGARAVFDVWQPHPQHGIDWRLVVGVVETLVSWRRPKHVFAMPTRYLSDHCALDRLRKGIGWIGWVPFALAPEDVPEASAMRPHAGGTTLVGQEAFWTVADAEAVASAQALDMRLNLLGVLPSTVELARGDWGQ